MIIVKEINREIIVDVKMKKCFCHFGPKRKARMR